MTAPVTSPMTEPVTSPMSAALRKAGRGVVWYLKQFTGEAKWDEYVDRCQREDLAPLTRREFERHRADHRESTTQSRCC